MKKILQICLCSFMLWGCVQNQEHNTITIAIAASLEKAFEKEIIPSFEKKYPHIQIQGVYDGSGKLQMQIEEGLEASIFFSASTCQMDTLIEKGYINEKSVKYILENKLVLIKQKGSQTKVKSFDTIDQADMIAIGDSQIVPAGQYAKMVLTHLGIWNQMSNKMSLATNVTEILSWVENGSCEVGIVYASDAMGSDKVEIIEECDVSLLDMPILYPIAMLKNIDNKEAVQKFYDYICSEESLKILRKCGFKSYEVNQDN